MLHVDICSVGWVKKVHYVYKDLLLWSYITMLSFIMIDLWSMQNFSMIPLCWLYTNLLFVWRTKLSHWLFILWPLKNVNEIHSQFIDECTGIYLWGKEHPILGYLAYIWGTFTLDVKYKQGPLWRPLRDVNEIHSQFYRNIYYPFEANDAIVSLY